MAYHEVLVGGSAEVAADRARRALGGGALLREQVPDSPGFGLAALALLNADYLDEADAAFGDVMSDARARGSALGVAIALYYLAMAARARGDILDGEAYARESTEIAGSIGWSVGLILVLGVLVDTVIDRDDLAQAHRLLEDHGLRGDVPPGLGYLTLLRVRSRLHLLEGDAERALADARTLGARLAGSGWNPTVQVADWRAPAAAALTASGRREEAVALADETLVRARSWGTPRARGEALRTRARAEGDGERALDWLHEAIGLLEPSPARVEYARALLERGAMLRRLRRPADARAPLREALAIAAPRGAARIAGQARAELAATGESRRKTAWLTGIESLTPSERRVAQLAIAGQGNPQIAQALFVTRKTVETHLQQAYRKLGISSRAELRDTLERRTEVSPLEES